MRTLLIVYLYVMYIVALPLFLVFSAVLLVWNAIECLKDCGEWSIKEALMAYAGGIVEGHHINMAKIEDACSEEDSYHEEGV